MSEKIIGFVTAISQKENGFGFKFKTAVWEDWINGKGQVPVEKGQKLEVEFNANTDAEGKTWRNYESHKILEESHTSHIPAGQEAQEKTKYWEKERACKNRICALQNAVIFSTAISSDENKTLEIAKKFATFIEGE